MITMFFTSGAVGEKRARWKVAWGYDWQSGNYTAVHTALC